MKSIFTLLFSISVLSLAGLSKDPIKNTEYFICHFNESITKKEINQLKEQGFQIYKTEQTPNIVYVKAAWSKAIFTTTLKNKMKDLIMVDENGNQVHLLTNNTHHSSPELLNLFFNFL